MRRKWGVLMAAAVAAVIITACGSGDGVVINGTTAAEDKESSGAEATTDGGEQSSAADSNESLVESETPSAYGAKIEIVTGDTTAEAQTEPETTAAPTTAAPTTVAPTTAAPTTAAPTTAAATTAAKEYAVWDVNKTMYAISSVRVRASYSTSSEVLGSLAEGESVQCTGESDNGWMRVSWKGHTGFVSKSYLSDTAPAGGQSGNGGTGSDRPTSTQPSGTTPGGTQGPSAGGTTPGGSSQGSSSGGTGSSSGGNGAGTSGSGTISGVVTNIDPSGLTIQTANGSSYSFVWGSSIPSLAAGDQVQVTYQGNTVVSVTK